MYANNYQSSSVHYYESLMCIVSVV